MTYWEEEEELVQLALDEEVGQVAHGIGSQSCDVVVVAGLFPSQCSHPFYDIICNLQNQNSVQLLSNTLPMT